MALTPAKCTQCGANINIDETKEAGICPNCGTAFITEKAINNYNTYNNTIYNIDNANISLQTKYRKLHIVFNYLHFSNFSDAPRTFGIYIDGMQRERTLSESEVLSQTKLTISINSEVHDFRIRYSEFYKDQNKHLQSKVLETALLEIPNGENDIFIVITDNGNANLFNNERSFLDFTAESEKYAIDRNMNEKKNNLKLGSFFFFIVSVIAFVLYATLDIILLPFICFVCGCISALIFLVLFIKLITFLNKNNKKNN